MRTMARLSGARVLVTRAALGRLLVALVVCSLLAVALVSQALADSGARTDHKFRDGAGCNGLANAYAHGAPVAAIAQAHGCDLSGITPARHATSGDGSDKDGENEPQDDTDQESRPPTEVVAVKCERIGEKLEQATGRDHGNSAEAFARQADKWSCPD
jgi:hypothetical protein